MEPLDPQAVALAKAIRQTESGGNFQAKGKSGEYGAYQFTEPTWATTSKKYGVNVPLNQATPQQQNEVAYKQIKDWKDKGYNVGQIASLWNSGKPDAYLDTGYKGVNKYGATYDVPAYAKSVATAYQTLKQGGQVQPDPNNPSSVIPEKGFLENVSSDIANRLGQAGSAISQTATGQINPFSGVLQTAGAVAGGIGDITTDVLGAITPNFIKKPLEAGIGRIAGAIAGTGIGKSAIQGASKFAEEHPELAGDIGAIGNIATAIPVVKGIGVAGKVAREAIPTATRALAKTPGVIGEAAKKSLFNEALEIVAPKETASVIKKGVKAGRGTVSGLMKTVGIAPDAQTIRAANAAAGIVRKGKTTVENVDALKKEIAHVADKLKSDLANREIVPLVSPEDLDGVMERALIRIGEDPTMVGNAEESAKRILNKFKSFLPQSGDISAGDVLEARKKLDSWIGSQTGGGTVFDPAYENAKSIALRSVRQEANALIAEKAPDVAVKEMLAHQSALYDAVDNIASKASREVGTGRFGRFAKRHPLITKGLKVGAGGAIGGLGFQGVSNLIER